MIDKLPTYFTEDNLRLLVMGAGATYVVVAAFHRARVRTWWPAGWFATLLGFFVARWVDWPYAPICRLLPTLLVGVLAAIGLERLRRSGVSAPLRWWTMLAVCGAIWLAIPENRPIVVVAGALLALGLFRPRVDGGWVDSGFAFAMSWAVLLGAHTRDFALVGGLLCVAPLVAFALVPAAGRRFGLSARPWLVVGTAALGFASARWVGVAPDAGWERVAVIAAGALVLAAMIRR